METQRRIFGSLLFYGIIHDERGRTKANVRIIEDRSLLGRQRRPWRPKMPPKFESKKKPGLTEHEQ
jgi:hypothetical protein